MAQPYNAETITGALRAAGVDASVHFFAEAGSTNDEARRLLAGRAPEWTAVIANHQTDGRGRMARQWVAPSGTSICLSVVLRPKIEAAHLPRVTMLGAVALMHALRRWFDAGDVALKWPNDVLLRGRKAAGILAEASFLGAQCAGVVLGIGVNVTVDFSAHPDLAKTAISMAEAAPGARFDRVDVLAALLSELTRWYPRLQAADLFEAWRGALATLGRRVCAVLPNGEVCTGTAERVDPDGALWLHTDGGARVCLHAGDVSLRGEGSERRPNV
jgi:BirA family biotin operon repressor/biotin-[acetyl-CoA-carboxylase] ligase